MNPPYASLLALDVGGSRIKVGLADRFAQLSGVHQVGIDCVSAHLEGAAAGLVDFVAGLVADLAGERNLDGIGIAVPGVVDAVRGVGRWSVNLGWRDAPLRDLIEHRTQLPVRIVHDVGAGATAEAERGAAVNARDWLFLALGTGLGSAFVLGGTPYRGSDGYGGELGHVVVDPSGAGCPCGKRGCLETVATAGGLTARYRERRPGGPHLDGEQIASMVRAGDPLASELWGAAMAALVCVVSAYCEAMNPELVVVGGGLADSWDLIGPALDDGLGTHVRFAEAPSVRRAQLGALAGLHGAAIEGVRMLSGDPAVPVSPDGEAESW